MDDLSIPKNFIPISSHRIKFSNLSKQSDSSGSSSRQYSIVKNDEASDSVFPQVEAGDDLVPSDDVDNQPLKKVLKKDVISKVELQRRVLEEFLGRPAGTGSMIL